MSSGSGCGSGWGVWNPEAGPRDRPTGAWVRPVDSAGVDCAIVCRTREDAEEVRRDQARFGLCAEAEVLPFDWGREPEARG